MKNKNLKPLALLLFLIIVIAPISQQLQAQNTSTTNLTKKDDLIKDEGGQVKFLVIEIDDNKKIEKSFVEIPLNSAKNFISKINFKEHQTIQNEIDYKDIYNLLINLGIPTNYLSNMNNNNNLCDKVNNLHKLDPDHWEGTDSFIFFIGLGLSWAFGTHTFFPIIGADLFVASLGFFSVSEFVDDGFTTQISGLLKGLCTGFAGVLLIPVGLGFHAPVIGLGYSMYTSWNRIN